MGVEKKVYSIRLDEEVIDQLKRMAEKENRTLSNYVETILKKHISDSGKVNYSNIFR